MQSAKLTESGSEQIPAIPTRTSNHWEWLPGELMSTSECMKGQLVLNMKCPSPLEVVTT